MVYHSSGLESPYPKCTLCAGWHSHWIPSRRVCTPFYLGLESHEIPTKVVHESEPNGAQCTEILTVCAPAKGCGSNVSLSNIKNLLLHAYEFQYLWPSIKRSTVRGRCATVHSPSRWAAIWHIYMDQLWNAEMDAGQRQGAGPTSGILTNWPRYPL